MQMFFTMVFWFLMGVATSYFAHQRGRDPFIWFFIGGMFGLIGLLVLFLLPSYDNVTKDSSQSADIIEIEPHEITPIVEDSCKNKNWYYLDEDRVQHGPLTFEEVIKDKKVAENTYIWSEGMKDWLIAKHVEEFKDKEW